MSKPPPKIASSNPAGPRPPAPGQVVVMSNPVNFKVNVISAVSVRKVKYRVRGRAHG